MSNTAKLRIKGASFLRTVADDRGLPSDGKLEVVVLGRSNVGKSSFINRLANQKNLARKSGTPGRTQELQFFTFRAETSSEKDFEFYLVDSPGFGYAKVSKSKRQDIVSILGSYLESRKEVRAVVLLNDCRRMPEEEELSLRDFVSEEEKHLLVVVTKIDKLKRSERAAALKELANAYGLMPEDLITTGEGEPSLFLDRLAPLLES